MDLKTGQQVGGAWLQVGAYLLDPDFAGYDGGILHVPRSAVGGPDGGAEPLRGAGGFGHCGLMPRGVFTVGLGIESVEGEGRTPDVAPGRTAGAARSPTAP